jgi:ADP-ribosylglycohydrolase
VDDPLDALRIGLTEIPKSCALAQAVRWALRQAPRIRNYRQARAAVDRRFAGMHHVHTLNNACLTIFGLGIGRRSFSKVIGNTVAMGLDNDCTAATAGSIAGAVLGKARIPRHWYRNFGDTVHSYLIRREKFSIRGLLKRFARQARRVHAE